MTNRQPRVVGKVVMAIGLTVTFVVALLPAWLLTTVLRLDPLAEGNGAQWQSPRRAARFARRPFSRNRDHGRGRAPAWLAVGAVALLAASVGSFRLLDGRSAPEPAGPDEAISPIRAFEGLTYDDYGHEDEPWAEDLYREETQGSLFLYDPVLGFRLPDTDGRYFNVNDGVRASWVPPTPTLTVWFFGGSTTFGIGQRDEHTIPSEVARLAHDQGLAIEPVNFGVPAYVARQEAILFQQLLTRRPLPDAVVFYDGLNDLGLQFQRADAGDPDLDRPSILGAAAFEQVLVDAGVLTSLDTPSESAGDTTETVFRTTTRHYQDGVEMASWAAQANGVPVQFFLQPQALTKRASPADRPLFDRLGIDPTTQDATRAGIAAIADQVGVIDLTAALDAVTVPVYLDPGHTNELGARVIAAEMYRWLAPLLRNADRAASRPGGGAAP